MEMMKFIFHTEYTTEDLDKMATIKNLIIDQGTTFVAANKQKFKEKDLSMLRKVLKSS